MSEERDGTLDAGDDDLAALDDILDLDTEPEAEAPREEVETIEPEPPPRQQTREERRVQALNKRWRESEAENKRLRADFDRMIVQSRAPAPQAPDPYRQAEQQRQEAERLALMAPHEQAAYYANQVEQRVQQRLMQTEVTTADRLDRHQYTLLTRSDPDARRLAQQVEDGLVLARQNGMNPTREAILNVLVGQETRQMREKRDSDARRRGRAQIARETTRPSSAASTVPPAQRRGEKRVEDMSEAELLNRVGDQRV
jgi:hypothetical protein